MWKNYFLIIQIKIEILVLYSNKFIKKSWFIFNLAIILYDCLNI